MTPENPMFPFLRISDIFLTDILICLAYLKSCLSEESEQLAGYVFIILNF